MSFLRHEEIYRSDVRLGQKLGAATRVAAPVLIGCDEFPVGYSLAGCPPAELASASPTGHDSQQSTLPYNDFSANGNYPLNFVSHSMGALQTESLKSIDKAIFRMASKSSGRNESKRKVASKNSRPKGRNLRSWMKAVWRVAN